MWGKVLFVVACMGVSAEQNLLRSVDLNQRSKRFESLLAVGNMERNRLNEQARAAVYEAAQAKGQSYKEFMPTDDIDEFDYGPEAADDAADYSAHQFIVAKEEADERRMEEENDTDDDEEQAQIDADDAASDFGDED